MIVDSNIFLSLVNPQEPQSEQVLSAFQVAAAQQTPRLNHVIFAEISPSFATREMVDDLLAQLGVEVVDLTADDAFRAGKAFLAYRRNGGPRKTLIPDFLIGAQASVRGWPILTRDPKRFASYFPEVELIDPVSE
jgi:predicted nucleic acid-binding protein